MLTALRTGLRFRLAVTLAAFAALCFVAPPAVLAFGPGGGRRTRAPPSSVCGGLFSLRPRGAYGGALDPAAAPPAPSPAREPSLFNRVSERLDRPPISLLIV